MKYLDRMLNKVKNGNIPGQERLVMAFISFDEGRGLFIADCRLWDGVSGRRIVSEHNTEQEANEAVHRVAEQYPNNKGDVIVFDAGMREVYGELTDAQLRELADGDPYDERINEILDSTGAVIKYWSDGDGEA